MSKCERFVVDGGLAQAPTAAQVIGDAYEELSLDKPANFGKNWTSILNMMLLLGGISAVCTKKWQCQREMLGG